MKILRDQKGTVLLWTMLAISLYLLCIGSVTSVIITDIRQSKQIDSSTQAYMAAEAGVERVKNYIASGTTSFATDRVGAFDSNTTYRFKVTRADNTTPVALSWGGQCVGTATSANYCYYSQGTSLNVARRIEGSKLDTPINQGKSFLQGPGTGSLDSNNMLSLVPDSGKLSGVKKFYLRWNVSNISNLPATSSCKDGSGNAMPCYSFGLFDPASPPASDPGGSIRVNLFKTNVSGKSGLTGIYLTSETLTGYTESNDNTIYLPTTVTTAMFELTYYPGGSTVLKVSDNNGICQGTLVRYDLGTQWNANSGFLTDAYNMFFARELSNAASSGPTIVDSNTAVSLNSAGTTIKINNIFFRIEGGAAITYNLQTSSVGCNGCTLNISPAGPYTWNTPVTITYNLAPGATFTGWSGDCSGVGACTLNMTSDKTVTASFVSDRLLAGERLLPGEFRRSTDDNYTLVYQGDGNLVLYRKSGSYYYAAPLWSSGTWNVSPGYVEMNATDGNVHVINGAGTEVWASNNPVSVNRDYLIVTGGTIKIHTTWGGGGYAWSKPPPTTGN